MSQSGSIRGRSSGVEKMICVKGGEPERKKWGDFCDEKQALSSTVRTVLVS